MNRKRSEFKNELEERRKFNTESKIDLAHTFIKVGQEL